MREKIDKLKEAGDEEMRQACNILLDVLKHFHLVYIIIDRPDRVQGDFIRELLEKVMLVSGQQVKIRALCIVSSDQTETVTKINNLTGNMEEKNFLRLNIDQPRVS